MVRVLILVLAVVWVVGCGGVEDCGCLADGGDGVAAGAGGGGSEEMELGVMTFNIRVGTAADGLNSWPWRRGNVVEVIRDWGGDVVGLQEDLLFQLKYLEKQLPEYSWVGVGAQDGATQGEYCAVMYRKDRWEELDSGTFWFSDRPDEACSNTWGNRFCRICTWVRLRERSGGEDRGLEALGTKEKDRGLEALGTGEKQRGGRTVTVCNTHLDHVSQPGREKSVQLLAKWIGERGWDDPVVVMGDFNAGEDNAAMRYLGGAAELAAERGLPGVTPVVLVDSFRLVHPDEEVVGTFNAWRGQDDGNKIDFVLVEEGQEAREAEIVRRSFEGRYPSDHYPVTAAVKLKASIEN